MILTTPFRPRALIALLGCAATLTLTACGDDDGDSGTTAGEGTATTAAANVDLAPIKSYLTDHTAALKASTAELAGDAEIYHQLAEQAGFDYDRLLADYGGQAADLITTMQKTFREANPAYEEAEGIVAGVPELAEYDVILDAGAPASEDPEGAVPFDLELADGTVLKQPGNFFFLLETALWNTNPDFASGVEPDLDGSGKVEFGESLPDAEFLLAAATEMDRYAGELDAAANEFEPEVADAMGAVVIMTPTMSEYFGQWKNSRFIAESGAKEQGFVATSRLSDIADILEGIVFVYEGIEPVIAEADPAQAEQTRQQLTELHEFAADLRDREREGERFTAEQADLFGSDAQDRAEAIAGQVSQAAAQLEIQLPEA